MLLLAPVVLGLVFYASAKSDLSCPSEMTDAVLDVVYPRINKISLDKYSGAQITKGSITREEYEIKCIQEWAEKNTTGCTRSAYKGWMDYYQDRLDEAKEEMKFRAEEKGEAAQQTAFEREEAAKRVRVNAFEKAHLIPKPPKCATN